MTSGNQSYWYGFEAIGTVRQLMNAQGQVIDRYVFDAWGNELTSPQSQVFNPFRYVGKYGYYLDTESALMLLGMRYYGASTSRFINLDPLKVYTNWFTYVNNNPNRAIDPIGLWCIEISNPPIPLPSEFFQFCSIVGEVCRNCYICKCPINTSINCISFSIGVSCGVDIGTIIDEIKSLTEVEKYILNFVNWLNNLALDIGAGISDDDCEEGCPSRGENVSGRVCVRGCFIFGGVSGCLELGTEGFKSNLKLESFCGAPGFSISVTLNIRSCR